METTASSGSAQRTDEWFADRAGKFTGSKFVDLMARGKKDGKPLKAWYDLCWKVATERITGQAIEGPDGLALKYGREVEPFAREAYELETGLVVVESKFITHPKYPFAGASPDGLIGEKGGLEMKCPKDPSIHLQRFIEGVPEEYVPQIQGNLWVTERDWWDFESFDPRMPENMQLFIRRVYRDDSYIDALERSVLEAEAYVQDLLKKIAEHREAA